METLTEKICNIEGSNPQGSVDLDNLTNFLEVIMPPKFRAPEFVKCDGTRDPYALLRMFCRKIAPYEDQCIFGVLRVQYGDSSQPRSSLEDRKEKWRIFPRVCLKVACVSCTSASSHNGRRNDQVVHR